MLWYFILYNKTAEWEIKNLLSLSPQASMPYIRAKSTGNLTQAAEPSIYCNLTRPGPGDITATEEITNSNCHYKWKNF